MDFLAVDGGDNSTVLISLCLGSAEELLGDKGEECKTDYYYQQLTVFSNSLNSCHVIIVLFLLSDNVVKWSLFGISSCKIRKKIAYT